MFRKRVSYDGAPIAAMTVRLRPDIGVCKLRVRDKGSGEPLQQVFALELLGDRHGVPPQLRMDENGLGYVPSALAGSTLSIQAFEHVPAVIHGWDGQRLDLQLEREQAQ